MLKNYVEGQIVYDSCFDLKEVVIVVDLGNRILVDYLGRDDLDCQKHLVFDKSVFVRRFKDNKLSTEIDQLEYEIFRLNEGIELRQLDLLKKIEELEQLKAKAA